MKTETHTVTIPIADYNELLKAFEDVPKKLTKIPAESSNGSLIQQAFEMNHMNSGIHSAGLKSGNIFTQFDFYVSEK